MSVEIINLLKLIAILFPSFLFVFTFRGFIRALVARWMGDETAYSQGFLSLNPLVHVNIAGLSIMLLVIFVLGALFGGFFHPSFFYVFLAFMGVRWTYVVPFEPRNFRRFKAGAVATILAGPLGCFLLTLICLYVQKYFPYSLVPIGVVKTLVEVLGTTLSLSTYFGVLAFLPLPPFDGGRLLQFTLPYSKQNIVSWLEMYSPFIVLGLFILPVVREVFFGIIGVCSLGVIQLLSKLVI